uniref:Uncharacterized protein n=1 Tax=Ciona savignyi TaxID=51511 RepID=H2ZKK0_CIOSA
TPNTRYRVRARITKILGTNFNSIQSPFGEYKNITTEKNSLFGRLTLLNRNLSNSDSNKATLSTELTAAFKNISSRVSDVKVVEIEAGNISHHEILVNDRSINPSTVNLLLNQPSLYTNQQIRFNAAGPNAYYYGFPRDPTWLIYGSTVSSCQATDTRKWVFHSDNGIISSLQFEKTSDARFGSVLNLNFNKNNLTTVSGKTENVVFGMAPNSVYGIRFDYLVKFCPADGNNTMFYDRIFMSNASSVKEEDKYTITY